MNRDEVLGICLKVAPKYGYDPLMVLAQIEQESSYRESAVRLEQGYLVKYVLPDATLGKSTPSVQVQMAASFGLGQLMGHSLQQLNFFFALDSVSVAMKLDEYIASPELQVETMCQWMQKKQALGTSHTLDDALRRYNGSSDYPPLVYARHQKLKGIYG